MDDSALHGDASVADDLLRLAARKLKGAEKRLVIAKVAMDLCGGNARRAERRFCWGRETVAKGLNELRSGIRCLEIVSTRGRQRSEDLDPQLAEDIRDLAEP